MSTPFRTTYYVNGVAVGFPFDGLDSIVVGSSDEEGPRESVRLKCDYASRGDLVKALMGGLSISGGSFSRQAPFQHPENDKLYCLSVSDIKGVKPKLDSSGWPAYTWATLTANFAAPTWQYIDTDPSGIGDPSGKAWTRTKFRESTEVFQPPFGAFYIGPFTGGSTGKLIDDATIGIMRPRVEVSMTRLLVPLIPLDDTMELIGGVNESPVQFGNRTFPRGCLLFAGLASEPRNDPQGIPCQDLEYTLLGNHSVEWNEFMAKDGTYQFLNTEATGGGDFPFEYIDFTILP